jgi:glutamate-ammonia-ligase adenylyltransferase
MFLHQLNIMGGEVFTYEPLPGNQTSSPSQRDSRRKIVDVFIVQPVEENFQSGIWEVYRRDLTELLRLMHIGNRREARGQLAQRVALKFHEINQDLAPLYPIEITIDNQSSRKYTLLRIESVDTIGFLYELTNSLAYSRIHIAHVTIDSIGNRVRDILSVTDDRGEKIINPERQRELRAAIVLIKHFTHLLPHTPNPVSALLHFREFIAQLFDRENWLEEITSLEKPEVLEAMARLLGVSDFLWDDFLRMQHTNLFPVVRDVDALRTSKTRFELQNELERALLPVHNGPQNPREDAPWKNVLNEFKDREMFRIDMRHILGHTREFDEFAGELTDLAEVIINSAYHLTAEDLRCVYGTPHSQEGTISQMSVCALGKCGGRELGFASDIELMFVYDSNGVTNGPEEISTAEFHEKTVQYFIQAIHARREGIFEVDLQLRPYGKAGAMAVSLDAFRRYFSPQGAAWAYERQALVKLRPIAGDQVLGSKVTALRDEFLYTGKPFDTSAMRAMRERQLRHLVTAGKFHPKYSPGGLVEIEYLVQGLQISYGHLSDDLRVTNTRQAMKALAEAGILTSDDYAQLRKAHTFLRWLIDSLRVVRGNAKDVNIPQEDTEEYAYLARRLQFGANFSQLRIELNNHTQNVQRINTRLSLK